MTDTAEQQPTRRSHVSYRPPNSNTIIKCKLNADKKSLTRLDGNHEVYAGVMEFVQAVTWEFASSSSTAVTTTTFEAPVAALTPPPPPIQQPQQSAAVADQVFDPFADFDVNGTNNTAAELAAAAAQEDSVDDIIF